jgi:hypothetical protein
MMIHERDLRALCRTSSLANFTSRNGHSRLWNASSPGPKVLQALERAITVNLHLGLSRAFVSKIVTQCKFWSDNVVWDFPATSNNGSYFPRNHCSPFTVNTVKMGIILVIALSTGFAMFRTPGTCHSPLRHDSGRAGTSQTNLPVDCLRPLRTNSWTTTGSHHASWGIGVKRKLQAAAIQQRFYSAPFAPKSCFAEKSRTAPKKGTKTQPALASGTTGMCLSPWSLPLPLFCPSLPLPLSWPAYASAGRIKEAATKAHTLRTL